MKKIFVVSGLMMAAIVALTGCQVKEQAEVVPGRVFTVTASTDNGTKTTNNGMETLWADKDAISVFYNDVTGGYSAATKMTLSEGVGTKKGVFTADGFEAPSGNHDWYAIYPSGVKSPASRDKDGGYTYIGRSDGLKQAAYDDKSALSGNNCPMFGVAKDVSGAPGFTMKQLSSVIEFNVVNKTGSPIKVKKLELDESANEENIVGSFYIDVTGDAPVYTGSEGFVKSIAYTTITEPEILEADDVAKVYMVVKPFTHNSANPFKIHIEGELDGKAASGEVLLYPQGNQCVFSAGKIKKVNVPLDVFEVPSNYQFTSIAELNALAANLTSETTFVGKLTGATVSYVPDTKNAFVKDATGSVLFYKSGHNLKQGQTFTGDITVSAKVYNGLFEVTGWGDAAFTGDGAVVDPEEVTLAAIAGDYDKYQSAYVKVANLEVVSVNNKNINVKDGDTNYIVFYNPGSPAVEVGDVITAIGTVTRYNATYELKVWASDGLVKAGGDDPGPGPQPSSTTIADVHAAATGTEVTVDDVIVSGIFGQGFFVTDNTDILYVYLKAAPTVQIGDKISLGGKVSVYKGNKQIANDPTPTITSSGTGSVALSPVAWAGTDVAAAYADNNAKYVSLTATATSTTILTVEGAGDVVLYVANNNKAEGVTIEKDKTYTLTGFVYGHGQSNSQQQVLFYALTAEEAGDTPGPGPDPDPQGTMVEVVMKDYVSEHSCTISAGSNATCYTNLDLNSAVRLSTTGSPNCGSFWGSDKVDWRLYQAGGGNAIVTVADGCTLQLVQFTFTAEKNGILLYGETVVETGKGIECSGNQVEFTVGNSGDKTNGQIKITAVKVIYTGSGTLPPIAEPEPQEITTSISLASGKAVYVGETVELGATNNANAAMTYESEDTSIATVNENGVVTGVAAGSVKVYARVAANPGSWTAAERYCTVTVSEKVVSGGSWLEFGISNIQAGDEFVIVGNGYAMNNTVTGANPSAVAVTIADGKITSEVTDDIVWTLTGNMDDGFTFYPKGSDDKWLYANAGNTNLRVGTGDRKVFSMVIKDEKVYLVTKDDGTARYLCVYSSKPDWRGYTESNVSSNATHTQFFKKATRPTE